MAAAAEAPRVSTRELVRLLPRTLALVWQASVGSSVALGVLTVLQAFLPAAMALVGKLIIDAVVAAMKSPSSEARGHVLSVVAVELGLAVAALVLGRLSTLNRELLRASLGNVVNERILEKALTLELRHFEDSTTYDLLQKARREASSRPLSLAMSSVGVLRELATLISFAVLLWAVSWWSVAVLVVAALPAFFAETKLAVAAFKLSSWRAPEGRRLDYLEWILTRDNHVKEVKLYGLGELVLGRYRTLYRKLLGEDRALAIKRVLWGTLLGALSLGAFYVCYLGIAGRAADGLITVGDLTLYLAVFRQGQAALQGVLTSVASMYEDALFMSNLFGLLALPTTAELPRVVPAKTLPRGQHRIELKNVSFRYPGRAEWALSDVSLAIEPGEKLALVGENGAGKSTLIKLLLRLHEPQSGEVLYGGVDVRDFDVTDLRSRFGAVLQDFVRYQFSAAENIGLGEVSLLETRPAIERAADAGGAKKLVEGLPQGFDTVLGGWFEKGHELSGGQWQKLAIARAFMRLEKGEASAEVLILDEPTASIDAEAEVALFERFKALAKDRSAIIISHRFSTVRMADRIAVLEGGKVTEVGTHEALLAMAGRYARLFTLQAQGYR